MNTTVIIGASSGIGESLAQMLLSKNEQVISVSRSEPKISVSKHYHFDVLSDNSFPGLEENIDGLVYCVGSINLKPFRAYKEIDFINDYQLNVIGAVKAINGSLKHFKANVVPSIVLFSSVAASVGMPFHASIAASKGAVESLTKSLAAEFAPKIRVNCISPSLINTPLAQKLVGTPEKIETSSMRHPMKRIGLSSDIAAMAQFLLSEEASWVSGQIFHVDGGMSTLKTS